MQSSSWMSLLEKVPAQQLDNLLFITSNGTGIAVKGIVRAESEYVVVRGRLLGAAEEGGGFFFVPYDQMLCLRLDRVVKVEEIEQFFGPPTDSMTPVPGDTPLDLSNTPTPTVPTDPAAASRLLLERIRAVRASSLSRYTT